MTIDNLFCPVCGLSMTLTKSRRSAVCKALHRKRVKVTEVKVGDRVEHSVSFVKRKPGEYPCTLVVRVDEETAALVNSSPLGKSEVVRRAVRAYCTIDKV